MNEQEKQLLIQDLCARLPFGVKCKIEAISEIEYGALYVKEGYTQDVATLSPTHIILFDDLNIKPYLRPMSNMTEEEREYMEELSQFKCTPDKATAKIDFYLKHNFDFRNLIDRGLAIAVTPENNPYK